MELESIISIIPTIGNIVGSLLTEIFTSEKDKSSKRYSYRLGNSSLDEVDFIVEEGKIKLCNRTSGRICVSFPAMNGNEGETIQMDSCTKCDVTRYFETLSKKDVDQFEITTGDVAKTHPHLFASSAPIMVSASGMVNIGRDTPKFIGTFTSVQIINGQITVRQEDCLGTCQLLSLAITPLDGSEKFFISDQKMENGEITIPLPLVLTDECEAHVGVTIGYETNDLNKFMTENNQRYDIVPMSTDEIKNLQKRLCVNRQ